MSRNSRNRERNNPGMQLQRQQMIDPFTQMRQIMRGFGGFHNDDFFGGMMKPFSSDPFESMFNFSDIHKDVHQRGKEGSYVCQTFVSSSKMGPDGKMHREDYFENNLGQHRGGNTISQKHQAYKNNQGVNRIAEERMLNDRGRKIVREKRGQDIQETNHYYNIDEEQAQNFDNDWKRTDKQMNFLQNHQNHLRQLGNGGYGNYGGNQPRQIEYNPSVYQRRESRRPPIENNYQRRR